MVLVGFLIEDALATTGRADARPAACRAFGFVGREPKIDAGAVAV